MQIVNQYIIANRCFRVVGEPLVSAIQQMPGFSPFLSSQQRNPDFEILLSEEEPEFREKLYSCEADGVVSSFYPISTGYALQMVSSDGSSLCLWTDTVNRKVYVKGSLAALMLRFALWIAYGLMNAAFGRIPIHGSCIVNKNKAYLFLGESGTGKSTHTRLWREYIKGSVLLNDDSPIISVEADGVWIYGSPWSGKTPCYKQERYPLSGCVRLSQAPFNKMKCLSVIQAYAAIHPSCPPEFAYDETLYEGISTSLNEILSQVPIYHLQCLPDEAAAQLSYQTMNPNED